MINEKFLNSIKEHMDFHNNRKAKALELFDKGVYTPSRLFRIANAHIKCNKCHNGVCGAYRVSVPLTEKDSVVLNICCDCMPQNVLPILENSISGLFKKLVKYVKGCL